MPSLRSTLQGRFRAPLVHLEEEVAGHLRTPAKSPGRRGDLGTPEAVSRFENGDPATVRAVRRLVLDVLRSHSRELKPYWDDLVLEVCAQAWRRVSAGGARIQNLEGLVARITHTRVIDLHRRRSRWRLEGGSTEHLEPIADPDPGPYESLLRGEAAQVVSAMIAAADERTRAIWRLLYFEGLKYREVAGRLGLPEGTLKRLVHESLRAAARRFAAAGLAGPHLIDVKASKK